MHCFASLRHWAGQLLLAGLVLLSCAAPLQAQQEKLLEMAPSLGWAPVDAAFYGVMLRNREQVEIVARSNAWARLQEIPSIQMGLALAKMQLEQPGGPGEQLQQFFAQPENKRLLKLLKEMGSDEIFFYGDADYTKLLRLLGLFNGVSRFQVMFKTLAERGGNPEQIDQAQQKWLLDMLADNLDLLVVPDTMIGFRIRDTDEARAQLARLEALLEAVLAQPLEAVPDLPERFARKKIGGAEYLTFTLDGRLVPWEQVPFEDFEDEPGQYDALRAHLEGLKLVVHLGVQGNYLVLSTGDTGKHLAKLGKGKGLLERPELAKAFRHADERVTSISYVSQAALAATATTAEDVQDLATIVDDLIPLAELDEETTAQIKRDVHELANDLAAVVSEPGALLEVAFLTEQGAEAYTYNWTENAMLDMSQRLTLLDHIGGDPLLAVVSRGVTSPEAYDTMVKWMKKGHGYFEDLAVPRLDDDEQEQYKAAMPRVVKLLARMDKVNREMLMPALADGQSALVLDARITSKHWIDELPPTHAPLPMLEPALVMGVSDAELLRKGLAAYRKIINDGIALVGELSEGKVTTDFRLAEPRVKETPLGRLYTYALPAEAGVDDKIAPGGGISEKVVAVTIGPAHTQRLLKATPPPSTAPLARRDGPLGRVTYFDWARTLEVARPWIHLGIRMGMGGQLGAPRGAIQAAAPAKQAIGDPADDPPQVAAIIGQVDQVIEVLSVFRNYSSATYREGETVVTHGAVRMEDLK